MKKYIHLAVGVLALSFLSGCATRLTDFTVISSKNVELSQLGNYQRVPARVKGEDTIHIISFIPTGLYPDAKAALDKAIETQPGGVALVDGVITKRWFYIPLIYGRDRYEVEGTLLVDTRFNSRSEPRVQPSPNTRPADPRLQSRPEPRFQPNPNTRPADPRFQPRPEPRVRW